MELDGTQALAARLGAAARAARRGRGWTQADVADQLGTSVEFYARVERGHALPSVPTLAALSEVLGVSVEQVFGRSAGAPTSSARAGGGEPEAPEARRLLRRVRSASPPLVRLLLEVVSSFEAATAARSRRRG